MIHLGRRTGRFVYLSKSDQTVPHLAPYPRNIRHIPSTSRLHRHRLLFTMQSIMIAQSLNRDDPTQPGMHCIIANRDDPTQPGMHCIIANRDDPTQPGEAAEQF